MHVRLVEDHISVKGAAAPANEYRRRPAAQSLVLRYGERCGYWKLYPQKTFRQTIIRVTIEDRRARVLMDSGYEVSIIDSTVLREVGIDVDTSEVMECLESGMESSRWRAKHG